MSWNTAEDKLLSKGVDAIVMNDVGSPRTGFDSGQQCCDLPYRADGD